MINNTLGLPFEEPEETYSTSQHLYRDLGIDQTAKGRIAAPAPEIPKRESRQSRSVSAAPRATPRPVLGGDCVTVYRSNEATVYPWNGVRPPYAPSRRKR